jgi:hypothetical protein
MWTLPWIPTLEIPFHQLLYQSKLERLLFGGIEAKRGIRRVGEKEITIYGAARS